MYKLKSLRLKLKKKKRKFFLVAILSIRLIFGNFNTNSITKNGFKQSPQFINKALNIPNDELDTDNLKVGFPSDGKDITKVILVKNYGFPPGADGFTTTPTPNYRHKIQPRVNQGRKPVGQVLPPQGHFRNDGQPNIVYRQAHKDVGQAGGNSANQSGKTYIPEFNSTIYHRNIQMKYKHAPDFGISGNYNKKNAKLWIDKIIEHMKDPLTQILDGTYRKREVTHYFNPETSLNVFFDREQKEFISGWLLNDKQLKNIKTRGDL